MYDKFVFNHLTKRQIRLIESYAEDNAKLIRAFASSVIRKKRSPLARALAKGDPHVMRKLAWDKFKQLPQKSQDILKKKICEEYDYCNIDKKKKNLVMITACLVDFLATYGLSVIIVMIKYHSFDELCECDH